MVFAILLFRVNKMKKFLSLLLVTLLLFLCSCKKDEAPKYKTADMLNITNEEKTFLGCKSRFDAVISAMSAKISTLENSHNAIIKADDKQTYFLNENYILTAFEPFMLETISVTEGFTADMTDENAQEFYKLRSEGLDISFSSEEENYNLTFTSETLVKTYCAEYDEKNDSFRYSYTVEDSSSVVVEEFLEFIQLDKNIYVMQSNSYRCYIEFNKEGEIVCFCCGHLDDGEFSADESIIDSDTEFDGYWVIEKGKPSYLSIHTFENNILTHEDRSSGIWKSIKINAEDHASAFYGQ